jgi:hypothetical protein
LQHESLSNKSIFVPLMHELKKPARLAVGRFVLMEELELGLVKLFEKLVPAYRLQPLVAAVAGKVDAQYTSAPTSLRGRYRGRFAAALLDPVPDFLMIARGGCSCHDYTPSRCVSPLAWHISLDRREQTECQPVLVAGSQSNIRGIWHVNAAPEGKTGARFVSRSGAAVSAEPGLREVDRKGQFVPVREYASVESHQIGKVEALNYRLQRTSICELNLKKQTSNSRKKLNCPRIKGA